MDQIIAAIIGASGAIIGAIIGALLKQRSQVDPSSGSKDDYTTSSKDPFLKYYTVAAVALMICLWLTMKYTSGEAQKGSVLLLFVLSGLFATVAVFWRFLEVHFYCLNPELYPRPSFSMHKPNYLPYFILLGASTVVLLGTIFHYTSAAENQQNRIQIFLLFISLAAYLAICRIGWAVVEYRIYRSGLQKKSI